MEPAAPGHRHLPGFPALRRQKQWHRGAQVGYIVRPCLQNARSKEERQHQSKKEGAVIKLPLRALDFELPTPESSWRRDSLLPQDHLVILLK